MLVGMLDVAGVWGPVSQVWRVMMGGVVVRGVHSHWSRGTSGGRVGRSWCGVRP